ncbi:MAG: NTP transferase domain-containing protein [Acidobacteriota bacterium]|nr:NTP transferase domain-containing protein [Acidobacteriota bacterium]
MTAVIAFVGARLSSSRLPGKHLLDLAGKPLIERLFERLERIPSLDRAVLATTDEAVNQPLIDWARATGRACFAWPGDVNDLVGRIDAAVKETAPSVLFYICGDCPLIEPTLIERMIAALKHHPSADFVRVRGEKGKKVIHQGIDAYPISTWRRLVSASTLPHEREHVGAATAKFADQASFIYIEDEPIFFSMEHRLSVDTPSDYRFMSQVYRDWHAEHPDDSIVDLRHVIRRLQTEPQLRAVNAEVKQKGVLEQSLPVLLVTAADDTVGLGHLRRMLPPARALQDGAAAGVQMLIQG